MSPKLNTVAHFLTAITVATALCGCAEKQKPVPRAKASPAGLGVVVAIPTVRVAAGTTCADTVTQGAAERFRAAAVGALTSAGFSVVTDPAEQAFTAALDLEVDYCSDAGIVSGTTALVFQRKTGASVWRGNAVGDQARGETASSTMNELIETMLYDARVIQATQDARR